MADQGWEVTAVDFSLAGLDKGRAALAQRPGGRDLHVEWVHADVLDYDAGAVPFDLCVTAYLQLPPDELHRAVRVGFGALAVGGTYLLVAHDSTNLTEGTGGPQDAAVLYTAEDVLGDLDGETFEVVRAGRVARHVDQDDDHGGTRQATAWDVLVRLVRR